MHVYYGYVFAARCTPKVLSQWLRKNESEAQSGNDLFYETGGWWEGRGPLFTICRSLGEIRPDLNKQYAAGAARQRYVGQGSSSVQWTDLYLSFTALKYLSAFIFCPHQEIPVTSKPLSKWFSHESALEAINILAQKANMILRSCADVFNIHTSMSWGVHGGQCM